MTETTRKKARYEVQIDGTIDPRCPICSGKRDPSAWATLPQNRKTMAALIPSAPIAPEPKRPTGVASPSHGAESIYSSHGDMQGQQSYDSVSNETTPQWSSDAPPNQSPAQLEDGDPDRKRMTKSVEATGYDSGTQPATPTQEQEKEPEAGQRTANPDRPATMRGQMTQRQYSPSMRNILQRLPRIGEPSRPDWSLGASGIDP